MKQTIPSPSQRAAIEAPAGPLLVLAGPGAGKTFCLIERIRFLLDQLHVKPERICAFTFTNKAAGEIAERLADSLGDKAALVKTGTIHAFCADLLREFGAQAGLAPGFGIADEKYQHAVLKRLGYNPRFARALLSRIGAHRFRDEPFTHQNDADVFDRYERFLAQRNVVDFDMIVLKTAELLANPDVAAQVRARWDCILVDEFQDLNPFQYRAVRELGRDHRNIFGVGDEEQSIYSWAGADPRLFQTFINDFGLTTNVSLRENRRCSRQILASSRRLVEINESMFDEKKILAAERDSPFAVSALTFDTEAAELDWILADLTRDREEHGLAWGDVALLYRVHRTGDAAEAGLLAAGLPCRLAQGRAIGEDSVVAYAIAALRVIASPDDMHPDSFLEAALPPTLLDFTRAAADEGKRSLREQLEKIARERAKDDAEGKRIRRALYALRNLPALGRRHTTLAPLVEDILIERVGTHRTILEERHDELTDPGSHDEVVRLADRMAAALESQRKLWLGRHGGAELALKGMLEAAGLAVSLDDSPPSDAEVVAAGDAESLGLPLALFKALQLLRSRSFPNAFRDFTAVDTETTDRDTATAELVEVAAVRVRDGVIVDQYHTLVRPIGRITPGAMATHHISEADVAGAPSFAELWPALRAFCGDDVLVAHNGYAFDFPILRRLGGVELCTYDTLPLARELHAGSAKLVDLAHHFGIDPGSSHRALDDTLTLAKVFLALGELKVSVARKTALVNLLDHLGIALTLWTGERDPEAELLLGFCRPYSFGRYSDCLELYDAERTRVGDNSLPTVDKVIEWLGGAQVMERIRAEKTADEKYPDAMPRMRRLIALSAEGTLQDQMSRFLERVALSRADGAEAQRDRINLLTLHSTKGLEFSRVYIMGVEDSSLPGSSRKGPTKMEVEEARRLLYVGMTRAKDRLVLTHVETRNGTPTGGHRFLDEMGLVPGAPAS